MRLLSYRVGGKASYGIINSSDGIIDLGLRIGTTATSLRESLSRHSTTELQQYASAAADYQLSDIELLPVIPEPAHIWCLAINYADHIKEIRSIGIQREVPKYPALFMRYADSVVAHNQALLVPTVSGQLDYEGELAVVIGKGGRHITEAQAMGHVAGYSCFNDGSVRDWQFHTRQIAPGKNFSDTASLGPWMVSADALMNPHNLRIVTRLDGQVMQDGNTSDMIFNIPAFIAYVSAISPLQPGDVLATGTPSGVGFSRKPPIFMKPGSICTVEIEGIGTLSNPITAEAVAVGNGVEAHAHGHANR
jgi:2-keto-4-pentenoate hydratase/2-oxohepta-3-ene-1,7-dioic acid hydratase in catechol pathway